MKNKFIIACLFLSFAVTGCTSVNGSKTLNVNVDVSKSTAGEVISEVVSTAVEDTVNTIESQVQSSMGSDEEATAVINDDTLEALGISYEDLGLTRDEETGELKVSMVHPEWYAKEKNCDYSITIEGDYYDLPCSLKEFMDNGWVIDEETTPNEIIESSATGWVILTRDGKTIEPFLKNFWNEPMNAYDTDVYSIILSNYEYSSDYKRINATLACGATLGESLTLTEDLVGLNGQIYKSDYNTNESWQYYGDDMDMGMISVQTTDGIMTQLHIECNCKGANFTGELR